MEAQEDNRFGKYRIRKICMRPGPRQVGPGLIPFCDCPRYISMNELAKTDIGIPCRRHGVLSCIGVRYGGNCVSEKHASKIAETFFNTAYGIHVAAPKLAWNGRQLTTDRLFTLFLCIQSSQRRICHNFRREQGLSCARIQP